MQAISFTAAAQLPILNQENMEGDNLPCKVTDCGTSHLESGQLGQSSFAHKEAVRAGLARKQFTGLPCKLQPIECGRKKWSVEEN